MPTPVIMPKMEMSQETATLIDWLVEQGQLVDKGQPIFEVETDKVTVEVESPGAGFLSGLSATTGRCGSGHDHHRLHPRRRREAARRVRTSAEDAPRTTEHAPRTTSNAYAVTPVAQRLADDLGVDLSTVVGTGPGGRITKGDVEKAAERNSGKDGKVRATPAARRVAREAGVELSAVVGSGPRGRVQAGDVTGWQGDRVDRGTR